MDLKDWIAQIKEILSLIFGNATPPVLLKVVGYVLAAGMVLTGVWGLLEVVGKIRGLWTREIWPIFYSRDKRLHRRRRQQFADHVESEIRRLNSLENWHDYRFAELEAEVEAEGRHHSRLGIAGRHRQRDGLRRERSLSVALRRSDERLILLEGEPGAGKSVALRHLAQTMAREARTARSTSAVIPLYINLKEFERPTDAPLDKNAVGAFVMRYLNRMNDRDIEEFLDQNFDQGVSDGLWLFLFDSFDEIPEVLSATEADETVRAYSEALADFLHGMNRCRGIIASRRYRGPRRAEWARFRVLPLSERRQRALVRHAGLAPPLEEALLSALGTAPDEMRAVAANPMFLGLLCEHAKTGAPFPLHMHTVFDTYIAQRLTRDTDRLRRRFSLGPPDILTAAEIVAYSITSAGLGLSPTREALAVALDGTMQPTLLGGDLDRHLDALEYLKFARADQSTRPGQPRTFTFAHRRFQEYFATRVVLREPARVPPPQLLTDSRWRDAAVILCQTADSLTLASLLASARELLRDRADRMGAPALPLVADEPAQIRPLEWPPRTLHILGLLQEGFAAREAELPSALREDAASILTLAASSGTLADQKWSLESGGIASPETLLSLLRAAFESGSWLLREVAYRQVARLVTLPTDVAEHIRSTLVKLESSGQLRRERYTAESHLSRLPGGNQLVRVARALYWRQPVDVSLHLGLCVLVLWILRVHGSVSVVTFAILVGATLLSVAIPRLLVLPRDLLRLVIWKIIVFFGSGPLLTTVLANQTTIPFWLGFVLFAIGLYVASWSPIIIFAALEGRVAPPVLLPFFPLALIARPILSRGGAIAIAALGAYAALAYLAIKLFPQLFLWFARYRYVLYVGMPALLAWLMLPAILQSLRTGWHSIRDARRWTAWRRQAPRAISVAELQRELALYRTSTFQVRLVRKARRDQLVSPTQDEVERLAEIGLTLDEAVRVLEAQDGGADDRNTKRATSGKRTSADSRRAVGPQAQGPRARTIRGLLRPDVWKPLSAAIHERRKYALLELRDEIYALLEQVSSAQWARAEP